MDRGKYLEQIEKILDGNLVMLSEYYNGDALRYLAVCRHIRFDTLNDLKKLKDPPLIFTEDEILNAVDIFPVEFLNIKKHHKLLEGKDIFDTIEISKMDLRHQLEFEFRSKLIHLRQAYMSSDHKDMENIILAAVPIMAPIIGALMYLYNIGAKYDPHMLKVMMGIDTNVLNEIHQIRLGKTKFKRDKEEYIADLIRVLEDVGQAIDKMEIE